MKKKRQKILLALSLVATVCVFALAGCTDGEEVTPVTKNIATAEEFLAISNNTGAKFAGSVFTLTADIDFAGKTYVPVGTIASPFIGTIDGAGHSIKGIEFLSDSVLGETVGLVGAAKDATFKNLTVDMKVMQTINKKASYIGAVVGAAWGALSVDNVTASLSLNNRYETYEENNAFTDMTEKKTDSVLYAGGIVGYANGAFNIKNVTTNFMADETAMETNNSFQNLPRVAVFMGGVAGYASGGGTVDGAMVALNNFSASAQTVYAGGIAGHFLSGTIKDTQVAFDNGTAELYAVGADAKGATGGIVGYAYGTEIVDVSFTMAAGKMFSVTTDYIGKKTFNFGGIAGYLEKSSVKGAVANFKAKVISGSSYGGVAGAIRETVIDGADVKGEGFDFDYAALKSYIDNESIQVAALVGIIKGASVVKNSKADIVANKSFGKLLKEQDVDDDGIFVGDARVPNIAVGNSINTAKLKPAIS